MTKNLTKRPPILRTWLGDELVIDSFAGGGGASSGIEFALGRSPDVAVNHDPEAIRMHEANHPATKHYLQDVWDVDPVEACGDKPVAFMWMSPTCTHFSKAKGTALGSDATKIRGLAWVAIRWAALVRPRVIAVENVSEFLTWGPLHQEHSKGCRKIRSHKKGCKRSRGKCSKEGCKYGSCYVRGNRGPVRCIFNQPIKERRGETYNEWKGSLESLGYVFEHRILRACDYGAPTTRQRYFAQARCDGKPIVWPEPTHGPGRDLPYRTAAECIDWSIPCNSIFDREKPLADKTLARIARGVQRFVLESAKPFVIPVNHAGYNKDGTPRADLRVHDLDEPMPTVTGQRRGGHALVSPLVCKAKTYGGGGNDAKSADGPLSTVTASKRGEHCLIAPTLVRTAHGEQDRTGKKRSQKSEDIQLPLPTVCASSTDFAIAIPYLVHRSNGERPEVVDADGTVHAGQAPRIYDIQEPLGTIVAGGLKHAACVALLIKNNGGNNDAAGSSGQDLRKPLDTIACRDQKSLTVAHVMKFQGTSTASGLDEPMPTVTAGSRVNSRKSKGTGGRLAEVRSFLVRYNGKSTGQAVTEPLGTVDSTDRYGLVTVMIDGEEYALVDIAMRMLTPRELYRAQGFEDHTARLSLVAWDDLQRQQESAGAIGATPATSRDSNDGSGEPVRVHARINCVRRVVELRSAASSNCAAASAAPLFSCPLPAEAVGSARMIARTGTIEAPTTISGPVESATNSSRSTSRRNGRPSANGSGVATATAAVVVSNGIGIDLAPGSGPFTTSGNGSTSQSYDSNLRTLCSSVADAIASCIRQQILTGHCFEIELEVDDSYDIDPEYEGKPLTKTAQIRMAGNSVCPPLAAAITRCALGLEKTLKPTETVEIFCSDCEGSGCDACNDTGIIHVEERPVLA